jgi:hypothetical protein
MCISGFIIIYKWIKYTDTEWSMYCNVQSYPQIFWGHLFLRMYADFMSTEKGPQNIEYSVLISIMCGLPFDLSINKNRAFLKLDQCSNIDSVILSIFNSYTHFKLSLFPLKLSKHIYTIIFTAYNLTYGGAEV